MPSHCAIYPSASLFIFPFVLVFSFRGCSMVARGYPRHRQKETINIPVVRACGLTTNTLDLSNKVQQLSEIEEARSLQYQCECIETACLEQGE